MAQQTVLQWSELQENFFDWVHEGKGSCILDAVAGSGKTSTIVEACRRISTAQKVVFCAFNKSIAEKLKTSVPAHVKAQTLNSMGFSAWMRHLGNPRNIKLDSNKTRTLGDENMSREDIRMYGPAVNKLVALAKAVGLVPDGIKGAFPLTYDTEQNWFDLMEFYGVELDNDKASPHRLVELSRAALRTSIELGETFIDFNDQLYLPVIFRVKFWRYDWVFVDEAQDVNHVQRAMLKMALRVGGRLVAVGDPHQAIYGFRGADTDSIANIKKEFSAIEMPLSISYRCPQAVVKEAQRFVSHIQASPTAPEGSVKTLGQFGPWTFTPTDGVVCRNTAPLIELAYKLIRKGEACRVLGREIGQGLVALIKKINAKSIDELEDRLQAYVQREQQKATAKGNENLVGALQDKFETIMVFVGALVETQRTIDQLIRNIEAIFTDNDKGVTTLCTVHKAKGLEFPRVFILDPHRMPSPYARQEWQQQQEKNIQYVAVTRAKQELYYITLQGGWADKQPTSIPEDKSRREGFNDVSNSQQKMFQEAQ